MRKVEGEKKDHNVRIYALSTCMWCRKTKKLLEENSVEYEFEDVDLLEGEARERTIEEVKKHNPPCTFPTTVVDGKAIVGYKEDALKEALGL
jgi:glutaredoxin-like protein NrdH